MLGRIKNDPIRNHLGRHLLKGNKKGRKMRSCFIVFAFSRFRVFVNSIVGMDYSRGGVTVVVLAGLGQW